MSLSSFSIGKHDSAHPHTYTHSSGSVHRLDHVSVPSTVLAYPCYTCTHDLGLPKMNDHFAAQCSFRIPINSICADLNVANVTKTCGYDHAAVVDPAKQEQHFKCAIILL